MAASVAGIQPTEFWNLTYRDLSNYLDGYAKKNIDDWKRTRLEAYMVYAVNSTKEDRKSMTEWMPLDGEREHKSKPRRLITKREYHLLNKYWN